jgi:guanylate kinase
MVEQGRFIEFRHYEFGMSYGLDRRLIDVELGRGKDCLAILNLGSIDQVHRNCSRAVTIFLHVDLPVIEARMQQRGDHTEEQIAERLGNAQLGLEEEPYYDFVVRNDGALADSISQIEAIISATRSRVTSRS